MIFVALGMLGDVGLTAVFVYFFFGLTVSFVFAIARCLPLCRSVIVRVTGSLPIALAACGRWR